MDFRAIFFSMQNSIVFRIALNMPYSIPPRLNLRLVTRLNHFHLDRIPISGIQVCARRHYTDLAYDRPSRLLIVRWRFWTLARSNAYSQVPTSSPR